MKTRCFLPLLGLALLPSAAHAQAHSSSSGKAYTKRYAKLGILPAPEGVIVRDIINYHRHLIAMPRAGQEFALDLRWDAPLAAGRRESVLQIGLATPRLVDTKDLRPLNVALVIDRSSSMAADDKMAKLKQALRAFVQRLRPTDRLSIVAYSSEAEVVLPSAVVGNRRRALEVIRCLQPSGYTNLHGGLLLGYQEVARNCEEDANHRVILLTDGRANRGAVEPDVIAKDSRKYNDDGIDLSTIGFGTDVNIDLLGKLAKSGRGLFHFVADTEDIQKVFVTEAQSLMGIVGRKVRIEIETEPGLEVSWVYGYQPRRVRGGYVIEHEDLNYGMTALVMVKIRKKTRKFDELNELETEEVELADDRPRVLVRVSYVSALTGRRETKSDKTVFLDPAWKPGATDHVVRKNFTIAVIARALHQMAVDARNSKYARADAVLARADQFFRRNYPNTTDPDLSQNYAMLKKYRGLLKGHIERFRDL